MQNTFNNLSTEKKSRIIHALLDEFNEFPFEQASVKGIIDRAKISRGSFYQYFEDLEAAYFFILDRYTMDTHDVFMHFLKENAFYLQAALQQYGDWIEENIIENPYKNLYKFKFLHWNAALEKDYISYKSKNNLSPNTEAFQHTSAKLSANEVSLLIKAVIHALIRRAFHDNWSKETFLIIYQKHIEWIIGGVKDAGTF